MVVRHKGLTTMIDKMWLYNVHVKFQCFRLRWENWCKDAGWWMTRLDKR